MIEVIVYGKDACPQCVTAKNILEKLDSATPDVISCTYKKLDKDFTREELFEMFPDAKTFPQITIGGVSRTLDDLKMLSDSGQSL